MMASAWGASAIVINTKKAALDLLGSRTTFASKPRWPMAELIGRQRSGTLVPQGRLSAVSFAHCKL